MHFTVKSPDQISGSFGRPWHFPYSLGSCGKVFIFHSMLKATFAVNYYCTPNAECQMHPKLAFVSFVHHFDLFHCPSKFQNLFIFFFLNPHLKKKPSLQFIQQASDTFSQFISIYLRRNAQHNGQRNILDPSSKPPKTY